MLNVSHHHHDHDDDPDRIVHTMAWALLYQSWSISWNIWVGPLLGTDIIFYLAAAIHHLTRYKRQTPSPRESSIFVRRLC